MESLRLEGEQGDRWVSAGNCTVQHGLQLDTARLMAYTEEDQPVPADQIRSTCPSCQPPTDRPHIMEVTQPTTAEADGRRTRLELGKDRSCVRHIFCSCQPHVSMCPMSWLYSTTYEAAARHVPWQKKSRTKILKVPHQVYNSGSWVPKVPRQVYISGSWVPKVPCQVHISGSGIPKIP